MAYCDAHTAEHRVSHQKHGVNDSNPSDGKDIDVFFSSFFLLNFPRKQVRLMDLMAVGENVDITTER